MTEHVMVAKGHSAMLCDAPKGCDVWLPSQPTFGQRVTVQDTTGTSACVSVRGIYAPFISGPSYEIVRKFSLAYFTVTFRYTKYWITRAEDAYKEEKPHIFGVWEELA